MATVLNPDDDETGGNTLTNAVASAGVAGAGGGSSANQSTFSSPSAGSGGGTLGTGTPGSVSQTSPMSLGSTTGSGNTGSNTTALNEPTQPSSSGQYINLNDYLGGNAAGATALGTSLGNNIQTGVNTANTDLTTANNEFAGNVNAGTDTYNANLVNSAVANPYAFSQSSGLTALDNQKAGTYAGPTDFSTDSDEQTAATDIANADQNAQLSTTSGGRAQLLQNQEGSNPYTLGGLNLNQFLVQNTAPALGAITNAADSAAPLDTSMSNAQTNAANEIAAGQTTSAATGTQTEQALQQGLTNEQNAINAQVAAAQASAASQDSALQSFLNSENGKLVPASTKTVTVPVAGKTGVTSQQTVTTPASYQAGTVTPADQADLTQLGLTPAQLQSLQALEYQAAQYHEPGIQLGSYLTSASPTSVYTPNTVASSQEVQNYDALAQMAGQTNNFLTDPAAAANPYSFNYSGAQEALNSQIAAGKALAAQNQTNGTLTANGQASSSSTGGALSGAVAGAEIGGQVGGPIGAVVGGVIGLITGCFTTGTEIQMADGSFKKIEQLKLLDDTALGGKVVAVGHIIVDDVWLYKDTYVTGNHAVMLEDGTWKRVEDIAEAMEVYMPEGQIIIAHPIVTEHRLLALRNFIAADEAEVPGPTWVMNADERLAYLNSEHSRLAHSTKAIKSLAEKNDQLV